LDGSQSQTSSASASFLHERVAELEAAAEKSKLKVKIYFIFFCAKIPVCILLHSGGLPPQQIVLVVIRANGLTLNKS